MYRILAILATVVMLGSVVGCSHATDPSPTSAPNSHLSSVLPTSAVVSSTPVASPATSAISAATPAPASTTSTSGPAECKAATTRITAQLGQSVSQQAGVFLVFTNTGKAPCGMQGYPGVAVLDSQGAQAYQATRELAGYIGGVEPPATQPPAVTLRPGAQASAILEVSVSFEPGGATCPTAPGLLVTLPDDLTSVHLAVTVPNCGKSSINPVVPGSTGRYS